MNILTEKERVAIAARLREVDPTFERSRDHDHEGRLRSILDRIERAKWASEVRRQQLLDAVEVRLCDLFDDMQR